MPNSRKRFSKKHVKKTIKSKTNTKKYKKNINRRKDKKSRRRITLLGGNDESEICSICHEKLKEDIFTTQCNHGFHTACIKSWCSRNAECRCPLCNATLEPNPFPPSPLIHIPNYYRVEFFRYEDPQNGTGGRQHVNINDIVTGNTLDVIISKLKEEFGEIEDYNILFNRGETEYGYINLEEQPDIEIQIGDMEITELNSHNIQSITISQEPNPNP